MRKSKREESEEEFLKDKEETSIEEEEPNTFETDNEFCEEEIE